MNTAAWNLLNKTELSIEEISLKDVNLNEISDVIAETLEMKGGAILVTDVQRKSITLDILRENVDGEKILGKKAEILKNLSRVSGVRISQDTTISSRGMLGWIAFSGDESKKAGEALERSKKIADEIRRRISKRAIIFSTGSEVASGQIKDTNTPIIADKLESKGYVITKGPTLKDDLLLISGHLRRAIDNGYGLIITTGGVGAEQKDQTVEAVLSIDPEAATPYITQYQRGVGRHYKDGVRIVIGQVYGTLIVALPGPNNEVKSSLDVLVNGLKNNVNKYILAEEIANNLRKKLK